MKGNTGEQGAAAINDEEIPINEQIPTYTEATDLAPLTSGEKISVAFGKIKKAISDYILHKTSVGTSSVSGHLKITDATNSTATDTAASAKALKTVNDALSALQTERVKVKLGSYVGSNAKGSSNPTTLAFDTAPESIQIYSCQTGTLVYTLYREITSFSAIFGNASYTVYVTWTDKGVSWYSDVPFAQANEGGITYHYIAHLL